MSHIQVYTLENLATYLLIISASSGNISVNWIWGDQYLYLSDRSPENK